MKAKVLAFCREEALFQPGDRVICALSGGADSVALLLVLLELRQELAISVEAAHFHHSLRGAEADGDADFCRELCRELDVPFHFGKADANAYEKGGGIEATARNLRYAFLQSLPCHRIATAHNADDNTETILQHMLRGSGLRGLCGIPPQRDRLVRPLLSVTKQEIAEYLARQERSYVEDSSNGADFCQRNRLRHRVIPLLKEEMPRLHSQLFRQTRLLRRENAFLDRLAAELLQSAQKEDGYNRHVLLAADPVLLDRALCLLLRQYYPANVAMTHIHGLREILQSENPSARLCLPSALTACRQYDLLMIEQVKVRALPPRELKIPGETIIEEADVKNLLFLL